MRVETKEKDLRLGFSVLGFPAYSLADSNRVFKLSLCLCLTPFFFFFFKISIRSDGNGDKEEGFGSRVFNFGVSYVFSCKLQSCFQVKFVFVSNPSFLLLFS